jgi:hypothetical protein
MSEFDWLGDLDIVCRSCHAVAVYVNDFGQVVIRRQAEQGEYEDPYIVVDPARIPALISALREAAKKARGK